MVNKDEYIGHMPDGQLIKTVHTAQWETTQDVKSTTSPTA